MDEQIRQIAERLRGLRDVLELTADDIARDCDISAEEYRPITKLTLTPANINKTTMVTTSEIIVIPLTSFVFIFFSSS